MVETALDARSGGPEHKADRHHDAEYEVRLTELVDSAPEQISIAPDLLGHASLRTTRTHYIQAVGMTAHARVQAMIAAGRRAAAPRPGRGEAQAAALVGEHGKQDALHDGAVLEGASGRVRRRTSQKRRSNTTDLPAHLEHGTLPESGEWR